MAHIDRRSSLVVALVKPWLWSKERERVCEREKSKEKIVMGEQVHGRDERERKRNIGFNNL